jgi:hypothetical protein
MASVLRTQPVDKRSARALDLTETAGQWRHLITRDGEPVVAMPSQTVKGLYYLVTETSCTCQDFQQYGLRHTRIGDVGLHMLCKHIRAVHFLRIQSEEQQEYAF